MTQRKLVLGIGVAGLSALAWLWIASRPAPIEDMAAVAEVPIEFDYETRGSATLATPEEPIPPEPSGASREALTQETRPLREEPRTRQRDEATLWIDVLSEEAGAPLADVELAITWVGVHGQSSVVAPALEGRLNTCLKTNERGRARFRVPPSAYWLHVSWGEYRKTVAVAALTDAEERTERIELATRDAVFIEGIVFAPDGSPAQWASVHGPEILTWANARGEFRLGPLAPGEHLLTARMLGLIESAPVKAWPGNAGVQLWLELGATLHVRAVDGSGFPLPGARLTLLRTDSGSPMAEGPREEALHSWIDLPATRYSLIGTSDEHIGYAQDIPLAQGSEESCTLVIAEQVAKLRVRFDSPNRSLKRDLSVFVFQNKAPVARAPLDGREILVPSGPCEIVLRSSNGEWNQALSTTAVAGEVTEVVFPLR